MVTRFKMFKIMHHNTHHYLLWFLIRKLDERKFLTFLHLPNRRKTRFLKKPRINEEIKEIVFGGKLNYRHMMFSNSKAPFTIMP